jgi:hypothetical protein
LTLRNLADARALTASSVRFLGAAVVSSELRRRMDAAVIWSTAARNAASLTFRRFVEASDLSHELQ